MTISNPETELPSSAAKHVTFSGSQAHGEPGEDAPTLEGRLLVPTDGMLHPGVVLCHANPSAGGHMDMGVMHSIEAVLADQGIATLRYNSRGVGSSQGAISTYPSKQLVAPEGSAETEDVGAALRFLGMQEGVDENRLALVGHSFGARISLAYLAAHSDDTSVRAVACIGLPVAWRDLSGYGDWPHPKLFITGDRDDFCPPALLASFTSTLPEPTTVVTLRNTGHFFEGRERDLARVVAEFARRVLLD